LVSFLGSFFEDISQVGHFSVHLLLNIGNGFCLRCFSLALKISHLFILFFLDLDLSTERLLFRFQLGYSLSQLLNTPLELLLSHLCLDLVKDILLQSTFLCLRCVKICLQTGHLIPRVLLQLKFLRLVGLFELLESLCECCSLRFMII
jgi:hypothetical protein